MFHNSNAWNISKVYSQNANHEKLLHKLYADKRREVYEWRSNCEEGYDIFFLLERLRVIIHKCNFHETNWRLPSKYTCFFSQASFHVKKNTRKKKWMFKMVVFTIAGSTNDDVEEGRHTQNSFAAEKKQISSSSWPWSMTTHEFVKKCISYS